MRLCKAIPYIGSYCTVCAHPLATGDCRAHNSELEFLDRTIAVGLYYTSDVRAELAVRGIALGNALTYHILELKNRIAAAPVLGAAMALVMRERLFDVGPEDVDVVTYVPKDPSEYKVDIETGERYNQAELLAIIVSRATGKPLRQLVTKTRPLTLSGLSMHERYVRAKEAYRVLEDVKSEVKGLRVLLVDDVRTSGATGNAIAEKLKSAGASRVYLLVAGRATFKPQFMEFIEQRRGSPKS